MLADRPAASDGSPGADRRSHPPVVLQVCVLTGAPETQPLHAVSRAHPPTTSTSCPAASNGGGRRFPSLPSGGRSAIALPWSPPPTAVLRRFGHTAARYVDRSMGSPHWPGTVSGTGRRPPPSRPRQWSNSDHAGKRYVLGQNWESRSRPGNCDSRPWNAISRELTSLFKIATYSHFLLSVSHMSLLVPTMWKHDKQFIVFIGMQFCCILQLNHIIFLDSVRICYCWCKCA